LAERISISRRFHFSAAHRYWVDDWDADRNRAVFGRNTSPHGHGHNYVLEVTLSGPVDPVTGMIVNLTEVKQWVNRVLERYDHKFLNLDHPAFRRWQPTTENIALQLWREIEPILPGEILLRRVRLWESEDLFAEVERA